MFLKDYKDFKIWDKLIVFFCFVKGGIVEIVYFLEGLNRVKNLLEVRF